MEQKDRWEQLKREHKKEEKEIIEESTKEIEEKEQKPMTLEEKQRIKKEMIGMIWLIIIIIIAALGLVFGFKDKKKNNNIVNDDVVETPKTEPLKNGAVPVDNKTVKEINNMFVFETINPLYEENILKIYKLETTPIEGFDFLTKMLFLTSHSDFNALVEEKGLGKDNKSISITTKEIDQLSMKLFNKDINLEYENFKYYYEKDGKVTYYDAVLKDGKYTLKESVGTESKIKVYSKMYSCYKEENVVYIESKVVFVNENGVYADPEMKELIGNRTDIAEKYLNEGYTAMFTYEIKNTGNIEYYFSESKTSTIIETPDYDLDYEEEVKESEKDQQNKK